ncbi:MAG TPA: lasso peptide biosynthesis B2 protein, partial [Terriglobales bacterium]|nr:lasso peptide biosynthesis B2 protein [Terriglobales bacterium]
ARRSGLNAEITLSKFLAFLRAFSAATISLRIMGLNRVLRSLSTPPICSRQQNPQPIEQLVSVFRRIRLWFYSAHGRCLFDSIVLCFFLRQYGHHPSLYIGVYSKPFTAHAWVQIGHMVLDEPVETIQQFRPIFVTAGD